MPETVSNPHQFGIEKDGSMLQNHGACLNIASAILPVTLISLGANAAMNRLKTIIDSLSVKPKTAAEWAGLNLPSFYDAYDGDDDNPDKIMDCWSLISLFSLAQQVKRVPTDFLTAQPSGVVDPSLLFTSFSHRIYSLPCKEKQAFENQCGWEVEVIWDFEPWFANVCSWNSQKLKDICGPLELDWLGCLNGLYEKWRGKK